MFILVARRSLLIAVLALCWTQYATAVDDWPEELMVVEVEYRGLERTRLPWLIDLINLKLPRTFTKTQADQLRIKLSTLDVFSRVEYRLEPLGDGRFRLVYEVEEKWTTIPVIRGAYGGGTPLRVLGGYDIHAFGERVIVGAEGRKYGSSPTGYVAYLRAPFIARGKYYFGMEGWRDYREYSLYDLDLEKEGTLKLNTMKLRTQLLNNVGLMRNGETPLWWGLDLTFSKHVQQAQYQPISGSNVVDYRVRRPDAGETVAFVYPTILYDDVDIQNIEMEGFRTIFRFGTVVDQNSSYPQGDFQNFYFAHLVSGYYLAWHLYLSYANRAALDSQTFLGGLDSIRGIPDGALVGTKAGYTNIELRKIFLRYKYLWLQHVVFTDFGAAADDVNRLIDYQASSAGTGLRFAIPQVHRLSFRVDYAWSLDGSGSQGISAGLNQFFQPYRPL